jgi:hypothetical protein
VAQAECLAAKAKSKSLLFFIFFLFLEIAFSCENSPSTLDSFYLPVFRVLKPKFKGFMKIFQRFFPVFTLAGPITGWLNATYQLPSPRICYKDPAQAPKIIRVV